MVSVSTAKKYSTNGDFSSVNYIRIYAAGPLTAHLYSDNTQRIR